jgi:CBS domain-containing membrane protein
MVCFHMVATNSPHHAPKKDGRFRLFAPILAGATLRDRMVSCLGALLGISLTGIISGYIFESDFHLPLIIAPLGASAVLLFAVPASPLAQPWPIIGGNTLSAFIGVTVAYFVHDPMIATGLSVSFAIMAMSFARCLHPPGGAAALTAVVGGSTVTSMGFMFPIVPVALNSLVLVALGFIFHALFGKSYPHSHPAAAVLGNDAKREGSLELGGGVTSDDVDAALTELGETFDIDREDLNELMQLAESKALARRLSTT